MERLACVAIGYVFGCILSAELVARAVAGSSIFSLGNGNPGMANVARSLGKGPAIACLAGDIGKVIVAGLLCRMLFPQLGRMAFGWAGIGATLGHDFPLWHGFRGGKGVATLAATLVLASPIRALVATAAAAVSLLLSGYLSIAAVAASASYVLACFGSTPEMLIFAGCAFALAIAGQWTNLWGIRTGTATRDLKR